MNWSFHSVTPPVGSATTLLVEGVGEEGDHGSLGRVGSADLQGSGAGTRGG